MDGFHNIFIIKEVSFIFIIKEVLERFHEQNGGKGRATDTQPFLGGKTKGKKKKPTQDID